MTACDHADTRCQSTKELSIYKPLPILDGHRGSAPFNIINHARISIGEAFGGTHKVKTGVRLGKMSFRLVVVPKRASCHVFMHDRLFFCVLAVRKMNDWIHARTE